MKISQKTKYVLPLIGAFILIMAALSFITLNGTVQAGDPQLTEEEAIRIAEEHTGGTALSAELEEDDGIQIYEVLIEKEDGMYEVEVDANDGTVLEVEEEDDDDGEDNDDVEEENEHEDDDGEDDLDDDEEEPEDEDDPDDDQNEHEYDGEEEGDN